MSEEKRNIEFTTEDIEKYHKGQLSPSQMHAIEKAALDDPFFADALEGYAMRHSNIQSDIMSLREKLAERVQGAKVVPLSRGRRSKYLWLRIAVMIVVIAGAALLALQVANRKEPGKIAINTPQNKEVAKTRSDSPDTTKTADTDLVSVQPVVDEKTKAKAPDPNTTIPELRNESNGKGANTIDSSGTKVEDPVSIGYANVNDSSEKKVEAFTENNSIKKTETNTKTVPISKEADDQRVAGSVTNQPRTYTSKSINKPLSEAENGYNNFRGRVTDQNNNPVPFANISDSRQNEQTYADAQGIFNFKSPDTVVSVEVRSIGYENNQVQLRRQDSDNQVVLKDDRNNLSEVVVVKGKANTSRRSRTDNMKVEESEPADGWKNYDTYLINNRAIPEEARDKKLVGEVELSFQIDKRGSPVDLKVEKSLCAKCDAEAIRLVKEGPKWKRKAKKSRTSVTVPF